MRVNCRNASCGERLIGTGGEWFGLCLSCTTIGKRAFALGMFAAGLLGWLVKVASG